MKDTATFVSRLGAEQVLISIKKETSPKDSVAERADSIVFGSRIPAGERSVIGSVSVSFRGESWMIPVAKQVLFPDPGLQIQFPIDFEPGIPEPISEESIDSDVGIAWMECTRRLAIAFLGADGEASYKGAIVIENKVLVGVAMGYYDGDEGAKGFAEKSLTTFKRLKTAK